MTHRLALFDCDGTLADSQHDIVAAMRGAFAEVGLPPPDTAAIRAAIGLSLPAVIRRLCAEDGQHGALIEAYRHRYFASRTAAAATPEPLFDGTVATLDALASRGWLLGIATGKSRRGLDRLLMQHGVADRFVTLQTADHHPSKPDPAMVAAALDETGIAAARTVVIGDTAFDMAMARHAGVLAVGVAWGYHPVAELTAAGAVAIAHDMHELPDLLEDLI